MKKNKKNDESRKRSLNVLYLLVFLLSLASAIPAYIQSSFLGQYLNLSWVGSFFVIANLVTLITVIFFPRIIKRFGNYQTSKLTAATYLISLFAISLSHNIYVLCAGFLAMILSNNLVYINMDIMVENFSLDKSTGKTRAIYFTASNLAWIIAQIISGQISNLEGYRLSFFVSAIITIPFLIIFSYSSRRLKSKIKYTGEKLKETIKKMLANKNMRGVFGLAFLLNLFYSCAVIFVPIYLHQVLGFGWDKLSIMFAIMLIPFVIFEIPAGTIADRYIGEKEIFHIGFFILILSLLFFAFNQNHSFLIWTIILFFSRTGAALVESMREAYFFKIVDAKDVGLINFFRTTGPLGYIAGSMIAAIFLTSHSLNYVFIILAGIMSSSFIFLSTMKDSK